MIPKDIPFKYLCELNDLHSHWWPFETMKVIWLCDDKFDYWIPFSEH